MLFYTLGTPGSNGLANIPIQFYLKDRLNFSAPQTATFNFIAGLPLYVGFLLGYVRDRWRPFGKGDLGYLVMTPPLIAAGYLWLAFSPLTYPGLVIATVLSTIFGVLLGASIQGMLTQIAQRDAMAGRLAVVIMLTTNIPSIIAPWAGGWLTEHRTPQFTFLIAAVVVMGVTAASFWRPAAVFATATKSTAPALDIRSFRALLPLLRKPSLYLPVIIMFLWNFSPGWTTPLLYYLTNTVKLSSEQYGNFGAIQNAAMVVFTLVYLVLCRRLRLVWLLWLGTVLGVIGAPLLLIIHRWPEAVFVALFTGAANAIAVSAYFDLLIRACPPKMEGTVFMLGSAMFALAGACSDVVGSKLFERGGFGLALLVTAIMTALVLPMVALLPRHLIDYRDGEMHRGS